MALLSELAQWGLGAGGMGGGAFALVKAWIALKPHLGNGTSAQARVLDHLEEQSKALLSIVHDIRDVTQQLRDSMQTASEYQREGRAAMQRVGDLWELASLDKRTK